MTKQEIDTKLKSIWQEVEDITLNLEGDNTYLDQMCRGLMGVQDKIREVIVTNGLN